MGLELNVPRSRVEENASGVPDVPLQDDNVPEMREGLEPPPDIFSGGEKWTVPDRAHEI